MVNISDIANALHVLQGRVDILNDDIKRHLLTAMTAQEQMRDCILQRDLLEKTMSAIAKSETNRR